MTKDQINAAIELENDAPDLVELQERRDFCDYWPLIKKSYCLQENLPVQQLMLRLT